MARDKALKVDRQKFPTRLQDQTPLELPVTAALEDEIAAAAAAAAGSAVDDELARREALVVNLGEVDTKGQRSGWADIVVDLDDEQVGAPGVVSLFVRDELELETLVAIAARSRTTARIYWRSVGVSVPKRLRFSYIIGRASLTTGERA